MYFYHIKVIKLNVNVMKPTQKHLFLSIILLVTMVHAAFASGAGGKNTQVSAAPLVCYQVEVSLSHEMSPCRLYQVEILDGKGYQVVPAKIFINGVSLYAFYERGRVVGVRVARLVPVPIDGGIAGEPGRAYECGTELHTAPAALRGLFEPGRVYRFELHPVVQAAR